MCPQSRASIASIIGAGEGNSSPSNPLWAVGKRDGEGSDYQGSGD